MTGPAMAAPLELKKDRAGDHDAHDQNDQIAVPRTETCVTFADHTLLLLFFKELHARIDRDKAADKKRKRDTAAKKIPKIVPPADDPDQPKHASDGATDDMYHLPAPSVINLTLIHVLPDTLSQDMRNPAFERCDIFA